MAFRKRYGAPPLHLLLVLGSFALTGYAGIRLLSGQEPWMVVLWFAGAALLHDLVLLPLYTFTDRAAQIVLGARHWPPGPPAGRPSSSSAGPGHRWINHVRVPVFLSGLLFLTYFPLILRRGNRFTAYTTLPDDVFLGRWLLITAVLFALSALTLMIRLFRSRTTSARRTPENDSRPGAAAEA